MSNAVPLKHQAGSDDGEPGAARARWEAARIAAAQAESDAGFGITGPELEAFLRDLEHSSEPVKAPVAKHLPRTG